MRWPELHLRDPPAVKTADEKIAVTGIELSPAFRRLTGQHLVQSMLPKVRQQGPADADDPPHRDVGCAIRQLQPAVEDRQRPRVVALISRLQSEVVVRQAAAQHPVQDDRDRVVGVEFALLQRHGDGVVGILLGPQPVARQPAQAPQVPQDQTDERVLANRRVEGALHLREQREGNGRVTGQVIAGGG